MSQSSGVQSGGRMRRATTLALLLVALSADIIVVHTSAGQSDPRTTASPTPQALLDQYCISCHNQKLRTAGLALDALDASRPDANAEMWERVIGKLRAR